LNIVAFVFGQDPEDVNNPLNLGRHMNYIPGPVDGWFRFPELTFVTCCSSIDSFEKFLA
jgi:hypothetical protein